MSNFKKIIFLSIFCLGLSCQIQAADLSTADYKNLTKQKTFEHLLYESYGNSTHGPAGVLGYQVDSFFTNNFYFSIAIYGIVSGNQGGFGIVSAGAGLRYNLINNLDFDSKLLIGSGGGGGVKGGGGIMFEVLSGLSWQFLKNIYLDFKIGYLKFPTGELETFTYNFGFSWRYDKLIL